MQEHFDSGATRSATWRREQLARVDQMLRAHNDDLLAALKSDLGKGTDEASITELALVRMELDHCKGHLSEWMATRHLASPAIAAPVFSKVCPEPRGVCLIIAPSNYPVLIALGPLIGALAAGNPTVIKPSELCGAVGACLAEIVPKYFPEEVCAVIEGGVNPTCELTARAWGLVFFTGSERVGKLIAAAAAPTLTPCVLELGGKAPVVVCEDAPALKTMARRLLWGKTVNGGQSCVAPDYVLCVGAEQTAALASELARLAEETFGPAGAQQQSPDFGRQASVGAAARLQELLREAEAAGVTPVCGGAALCDPAARFVPPTVLVNPPAALRLCEEEIFGPVVVIRTVESVDAAIAAIKAQPGTPLALYVFTRSRATAERVISACPSGGAVRNDFLIQFAGVVPFGGLGSSGYGAAHGEATFAAFTHYRSVLHKPCVEALEFGGLRFAPYRKFGGVSGKLFYTLMQASPTVPPLPRSLLGRLMLACVLTVLAVALPALLGAPWARRALATAMARSASALADAAMAVEATCAD